MGKLVGLPPATNPHAHLHDAARTTHRSAKRTDEQRKMQARRLRGPAVWGARLHSPLRALHMRGLELRRGGQLGADGLARCARLVLLGVLVRIRRAGVAAVVKLLRLGRGREPKDLSIVRLGGGGRSTTRGVVPLGREGGHTGDGALARLPAEAGRAPGLAVALDGTRRGAA